MGASGTLVATGGTVTVRFEQTIATSTESLWAAITEPSELARWLAEAELDAQVGGRVHLVWPGQGEMHGVVLVCEPGKVLEYSWTEDTTSVLRLELEPTAAGVTGRLVHSGTTPKEAPGFGAGWQSHLEALASVLTGGDSTATERDARYEELRPSYDELLERA
jgi:uncharacterized protein YndB with AHSA1/START domain